MTVLKAVSWDVTQCGSCRTDVSEEPSVTIIRVERIGELGTLAVTSKKAHAAKKSVASYG
jgi:hypothetical protein